MNKLSIALAGLLMSATSGLLYAASEGKSVDLAVTFVNSIKLTGTVVGATRTYSSTEIRSATKKVPHPTITLGTLGIESNNPGNCTLSFSTLNGFSLIHTQQGQPLTSYELDFKAQTINPANLSILLPSCNTLPSPFDFRATGNIKKKVKAGVYSDIVTITVTTQ